MGNNISVVIPTWSELENGNLYRQLRSFARQDVTPENFELVYVVNNTPKEAQQGGDAFYENQRTMSLLRYVGRKTDKLPDELVTNEWRRGIIQETRDARLRVRVIDLSSKGIPRNIEKLRLIGLEDITARTCPDDIVAQMDADTTVGPGYVRKMQDHFADPCIDSLLLCLDYYTAEGPRALFETSFHHRYKIAWQNWHQSFNRVPMVGGPQIAARIRAYGVVDRTSLLDMAEDFKLSTALSSQTDYKFGYDIWPRTADRAREGGYDSAIRLEAIKRGRSRLLNNRLNTVFFLTSELERIAQEEPEEVHNEGRVGLVFERYGFPFEMEGFRERVLDFERPFAKRDETLDSKIHFETPRYLQERHGIQTTGSPTEQAKKTIKFLERILSSREIISLEEAISRATEVSVNEMNFARSMVHRHVQGEYNGDPAKSDPIEEEFIEQNPWFRDLVTSLPESYKTADEAMVELSKQFPDWLGSFKGSPIREGTALLHGLTRFVRRARSNPTRFPKFIEWYNQVHS